MPAASNLYQYDLRGNLSQDAHWLYTWDAENRLMVQEQKYPGTATDGAREVKRLEFSYDAIGRRLSKKLLVSQKLSDGQLVGTWSFSKETVFIWQDWVLLAEFVKTSSGGSFELRRSYLWGLDVDGTLGGAGGVGGLLWVADYVPGQATSNRQLAPWYDGNGNVMGWMENDDVQPLPQHRLEYDPYGKLLVDDTVRPTRNQKQRNLGVSKTWLERPAFAFSTKYEDTETGLLYYGYRYYAPAMGRWISRDPIGEKGGVNIYGILGNNTLNSWDKLGLSCRNVKVVWGKDVYDVLGGGISFTLKGARCCCPTGSYSYTLERIAHFELGIGISFQDDGIASERIGGYFKMPLVNVDIPVKWTLPCGDASQTVDASVDFSVGYAASFGGGLGFAGGEYTLLRGYLKLRIGGEYVINSQVLNAYGKWELEGTEGAWEIGIGPFVTEFGGKQYQKSGDLFDYQFRFDF